MVGVELHQTGDPSELRDVGRKDAEMVHLAQRLGHTTRRPEDGQEESQHAIRAAVGVVDQVQVAADGLLGIEAEIVPHLLPVPEDFQQPDRIVPEAVLLGGEDVDLPVELDEIVPDVSRSQLLHDGLHLGAGPLDAPVDDPPGELMEPPRPAIVLLHELLDSVLRTVAVPQVVRHRDLNLETQDIVLASLEVVKLVSHPEQEVEILHTLSDPPRA